MFYGRVMRNPCIMRKRKHINGKAISSAMAYEVQAGILLQTCIGAVLGAIIGYEREKQDKPVGLRTTMLVGAATALLMSISPVLVSAFEGADQDVLRMDPFRVIEAIVVGISFIGAGTILQQQDKVKHLTTAATTLVVAGIGIAVGLQQYLLAVGVTLLVLIVNRALLYLERRM